MVMDRNGFEYVRIIKPIADFDAEFLLTMTLLTKTTPETRLHRPVLWPIRKRRAHPRAFDDVGALSCRRLAMRVLALV